MGIANGCSWTVVARHPGPGISSSKSTELTTPHRTVTVMGLAWLVSPSQVPSQGDVQGVGIADGVGNTGPIGAGVALAGTVAVSVAFAHPRVATASPTAATSSTTLFFIVCK